ncbi:MAG: methylated-DNA--[protein]-cysteine S-methyltransferase [Bdellovibrionota bacterium]
MDQKNETLYFKDIKTPVGMLKLVAHDKGIVALLWEKEKLGRVKLGELKNSSKHSVLLEGEKQLKEYFAGKRTRFDLPLDPIGTDFQKKVWKALRKIPFGKTQSYGELAKKIDSPKASRAVGAANGRNPISIIVPCHRVIGMNGTLTGFAGGLNVKATLLNLEGITLF